MDPQPPQPPSQVHITKQCSLVDDPSLSPQQQFCTRSDSSYYPSQPTQDDDGAYNDEAEQDELANGFHDMEVDEGATKYAPEDRAQPATVDYAKAMSSKNFVFKLFQMMEDIEARAYIQWNSEGNAFVVNNQEEFATKVLGKHFKHNNFSSFVRQLNMYDFHKTNRAPRSQRGAAQHQQWVFSHPKFRRGHPELLPLIKRKANEPLGGPSQYSEDQPQADRRPSFTPVQSGSSSTTTHLETIVLELRVQNAELKQRIQCTELTCKRLEDKLNQVLSTIPVGQQQLTQAFREPIQSENTLGGTPAPRSAREVPVAQYEYGVPLSLVPIDPYQHHAGSSLPSASTECQSPIAPFHTGHDVSKSFGSLSSETPHRQAPSNMETSHAAATSPYNPVDSTMHGGSSSYQSAQHQPNTVSFSSYDTFTFNGFNPPDAGQQYVAGSSSQAQLFSSTFPSAYSPNQSRIPLGGRSMTVAKTPSKAGPMAAVPPKGPPPDSAGRLW